MALLESHNLPKLSRLEKFSIKFVAFMSSGYHCETYSKDCRGLSNGVSIINIEIYSVLGYLSAVLFEHIC